VPTKLKAEALSHDQIKITWGPVIDNGGAVVSYLLKVINKDTGTREFEDVNLQRNKMDTILNNLKSNTEYR